MSDFMLSPPVVPFSLALGLLIGLLALEILVLFAGGTLFGKDAGKGDTAFDPEIDPGFGLPAGAGPEVAAPDMPSASALAEMNLGDLEVSDLDLGPSGAGVDAAADAMQQAGPSTIPPGLATALGLGKVPFLIWLAAVLAGFGLAGYLVQSLSTQVFGGPLPAILAMLPAGFVGLWFARAYGRTLSRLIPGTESSIRSKAMLNRKRGVVSQGTARAGRPAEVRVSDSFGNIHYIRAEPLDQTEAIASGTEVLVLRIRLGPARGQFRILSL